MRSLIDKCHRCPIFVAHVIVDERDASGRPSAQSAAVVNGLFRGDLGFAGVIASDRIMDPGVVARYGLGGTAVLACVDMVVLANQSPDYDLDAVHDVREAILDAAGSGAISEQRAFELSGRTLRLNRDRGILESA